MRNWTVHLIKAPIINPFQDGFFPRDYHYKGDAQTLVDEVESYGGKAEIRKYEPATDHCAKGSRKNG